MNPFENFIHNILSFFNPRFIKPSDIQINNDIRIECKLTDVYSRYYKKQNPRISIYLNSLTHSHYLLVGLLLKRTLKIYCWNIIDILPLVLKSKLNRKHKRFQLSLKKLLRIPTLNPYFF